MNPGDVRRSSRGCGAGWSLNEGRGVNPGDTQVRYAVSDSDTRSFNEGRGVNPGDISDRRMRSQSSDTIAQRRPGREPRRHASSATMADASIIAQRRPGREPRRHPPESAGRARAPPPLNEGRGVNPGDT